MSAKKAEKPRKEVLVPVKELISVQTKRLGIENPDLTQMLGYGSPNVISMLKSGSMRLPVNKIAKTAEVLKIDPLYLAMCVDADSGFNLTELLLSVSKRTSITLNEEKLIIKLRKLSNNLDVDLDDYPAQEEAMLKAYAEAAAANKRDHESDVRRIMSNPNSALARGQRREDKDKEQE